MPELDVVGLGANAIDRGIELHPLPDADAGVRGWDMRETADFANACGALNAIHLGARSGMVSLAAVQKFMADTRRRL